MQNTTENNRCSLFISCLLMLVMVGFSPAHGQTGRPKVVDIKNILPSQDDAATDKPGNVPSNSLPDIEEHILQPGDKLTINIPALPDIPKEYEIRIDGSFYHPVVGEIKAQGKTVAQLTREFKRLLARELKHPTFKLGLSGLADTEVAVLGEVKSQGKYKVAPGATVLDVVAKAGGLSPTADPRAAVLIRGGKRLAVSLMPPADGTNDSLVRVRPGDILYVYPGVRVSVNGEVFNPGVFAVSRDDPTPEEAVYRAGGGKPTAALNRVQLIRPTLAKPIILDLTPGKPHNLPEPARRLRDGDVLMIPPRQAVVLGGVSKPGPFRLTGGETLIDIVNTLGGANKGNLDDVKVIRYEDIKAGRAKVEKYDLTKFYEEGVAVNVPIHDGDLIFIPPKERGYDLFGNMNILGLIGIARTIFRF